MYDVARYCGGGGTKEDSSTLTSTDGCDDSTTTTVDENAKQDQKKKYTKSFTEWKPAAVIEIESFYPYRKASGSHC